MKKLFLFLMLIITLTGFSQKNESTKPDYSAIEKQIKDKNSEFYYPELLKKFNASDSTITLEQRRHLYYGYTFQKEYDPYSESNQADSLRIMMKKGRHTEEDFQKISSLCDASLKENPFDLRAFNYKLYACQELRDEPEFIKNLTKMKIIIDALVSSGDGLTKETAFYVITTSHEYDLLNIIGLNFSGKQSLVKNHDYLEVTENAHGIKGMYFDVSPCLKYLSKTSK